ncbi:Dabb family protein [Pseudosulfitobacter sp. SM2401]|uniref:Dabb family protein n=1 Tax=Pseudosulfitobacter sp. SM2401 TaxID=3350098 RepID=UPI0036F20B82
MIRHIVLTKCKPDTSQQRIEEIFAGLEQLVENLDGAQAFTGAPSTSPENLERGYTHGFVIDFDSWAALKTYAEHPEHKALGALLVANAVNGIDGILVIDLDV